VDMLKQPKKIIVIIDLTEPECIEHLFGRANRVRPNEKIEITNFSESIGVNNLGFFITNSVTENEDQIIIMASK
jgi:hypothetical protein